MKLKHGIILLAIGLCAEAVGALFKIQHWPGGSIILILSTALKIAGFIIIAYKLIRNPALRDFLNR